MSIIPGAIALSRIPAPIHSGDTALRRTHCATATFDAGYTPFIAPNSSAPLRAAASSPERHNSMRSTGTPGEHVVEFELIATAAGAEPAASSGRRPSSNSIVPK